MTRTSFVPSLRRRIALAPLFALLALAAPAVPAAAGGGAVTRPLAPTNTALLGKAAHGAAGRLVAQVPLSPGAKVGLRPEGAGKLDADVREALLQALTERRISCVLLPALDVPTDSAEAAATAAPRGPGAANAAAADSAAAPADFAALQAERRAQAARAESLARASGSVLAAPGDLPVLTWRVQEARVDYVRQFRGGLLGAQRVERRARVDVALRLTPAGAAAITWTATADTTVGDVVLKSELAALEDRTRPETRPTLPSSSFKKVLEPALVVVLIAGLVSLFYQNRP